MIKIAFVGTASAIVFTAYMVPLVLFSLWLPVPQEFITIPITAAFVTFIFLKNREGLPC